MSDHLLRAESPRAVRPAGRPSTVGGVARPWPQSGRREFVNRPGTCSSSTARVVIGVNHGTRKARENPLDFWAMPFELGRSGCLNTPSAGQEGLPAVRYFRPSSWVDAVFVESSLWWGGGLAPMLRWPERRGLLRPVARQLKVDGPCGNQREARCGVARMVSGGLRRRPMWAWHGGCAGVRRIYASLDAGHPCGCCPRANGRQAAPGPWLAHVSAAPSASQEERKPLPRALEVESAVAACLLASGHD